MGIPNLEILLILAFSPLLIGLFVIGFSLYKKKKVPIYALFILLVGVLFMRFGTVTTYSSSAMLDKSAHITQYSIYRGESYSTPIRVIGKVRVSKEKSEKDPTLNKRVKVQRNLFKGTRVSATEDNLISIKE